MGIVDLNEFLQLVNSGIQPFISPVPQNFSFPSSSASDKLPPPSTNPKVPQMQLNFNFSKWSPAMKYSIKVDRFRVLTIDCHFCSKQFTRAMFKHQHMFGPYGAMEPFLQNTNDAGWRFATSQPQGFFICPFHHHSTPQHQPLTELKVNYQPPNFQNQRGRLLPINASTPTPTLTTERCAQVNCVVKGCPHDTILLLLEYESFHGNAEAKTKQRFLNFIKSIGWSHSFEGFQCPSNHEQADSYVKKASSPLAHPCPKCLALPHEACHGDNRRQKKIRKSVHVERYTSARKTRLAAWAS